jgi:hypothetical protein
VARLIHSLYSSGRLPEGPSSPPPASLRRLSPSGHPISNRPSSRLEFSSSPTKQTTEALSNRPNFTWFLDGIRARKSALTNPLARRNETGLRRRIMLPDPNRQLETIRNRRNPSEFNQMTFSNRPKKKDSISPSQLTTQCIPNRPYRRLEINISPTKQRTEVLSNRPKSSVLLFAFLTPPRWLQPPSRARIPMRSPHLKILLRNPSGLQDRACSPFHLAGTQ